MLLEKNGWQEARFFNYNYEETGYIVANKQIACKDIEMIIKVKENYRKRKYSHEGQTFYMYSSLPANWSLTGFF